jgi:fumarylacetoacetase
VSERSRGRTRGASLARRDEHHDRGDQGRRRNHSKGRCAVDAGCADPRGIEHDRKRDTAQGAETDEHAARAVSTSTSTRAEGQRAQQIIRSNARHLYGTPAQMVAHHTSGGCSLMPGDLIGRYTISGPEREELSSLLELTRGGAEPVQLADGERRS